MVSLRSRDRDAVPVGVSIYREGRAGQGHGRRRPCLSLTACEPGSTTVTLLRMRSFMGGLTVLRYTSVLLLLVTPPAWSEELRVGAAAVGITPPDGTPMAGYYHERGSDGVHDGLFAKALVLDSGGSRAA